ncbi:MAG: cysteine desulfurase [Helicobacteraceae bacterium]|jgi:cysteine desulfurase/selenocysteine lyase|nr:cysteine desulfurase [Helicobacteraceae bacterium]
MKRKLLEEMNFHPVLEAYEGVAQPCEGIKTARETFATSEAADVKTTDFDGSRAADVIGDRSVADIRADFPIFAAGDPENPARKTIWLDNASTTQKPRSVIDREANFYARENSNVKRGAYRLASNADKLYEDARSSVARFIGAKPQNLIFTRGATEGINLAAQATLRPLIKRGDEIIVTILEHHANIVPYQMIAAEKGAILRVAPVRSDGQIDLAKYKKLFSPRAKFAAIAHISNALGTILPIAEMAEIARLCGAKVLIDAAQSISHIPIDVRKIGADILVFSGHKVYAPFGIGALWANDETLELAKPYHGGGNMIADVTFTKTLYQKAPNKFEAGTPNIAGAIALAAALEYIGVIGMKNIARYESDLTRFAISELSKIDGLRIIGNASDRAGAISFVMERFSIEEIAGFLNERDICLRAGHHCAQPILRFFGLEATLRASLGLYNTVSEIEALASALRDLAKN